MHDFDLNGKNQIGVALPPWASKKRLLASS
jgi:hypothetical protein